MTLYDPYSGMPLSSSERTVDIAAAEDLARRQAESDAESRHPAEGMDLEPGPGQAILLRDEQPEFIIDESTGFSLVNPLAGRNNFARVARVGPDRPEVNQKAWFAKDDLVWINASLLEKIDLGGEIVEMGPFSAIKGKFVPKKAK